MEGEVLEFFRFVLKQFTLPSKKKNYANIGKQIEDIADKKAVADNPFIVKLKWMVEQFLSKCAPVVDKTHLVSFLL